MTPRFVVGQCVKLSLGMIHPGKSLICEIVQLLPFDEGSFQYRVKSMDEKHHRRAGESALTLLADGYRKDHQASTLPATAPVNNHSSARDSVRKDRRGHKEKPRQRGRLQQISAAN
jgi:hypothetical protein